MLEKLSYEQIKAAAQSLRQQAESMEGLLNEVNGEMDKVNTEGVWKSSAAEKTYETFKELAAKFPSFYEKVTSYATFLEQTAQAYEDADNAIAGKVA